MPGWSELVAKWVPPEDWTSVRAVDAHTEGEPLRVVLDGYPDLGAGPILERRRRARRDHDGLRRALMWEPRGHADMYGCLVGPPATAEADIGVLFTHNEGFSTMCGHGIIGVTTVIVECGLHPPKPLGIDTPAGFIRATPHVSGGRVERVSFVNVPSFAARLGATVEVPGVGAVRYDLAYGGAYYAYVDAAAFDLSLTPNEAPRLIRLGRAIKDAVQAADPPEHPDAVDLGFMYGTIFVGPPHDEAHHSRNVCVFADGEIDRCPTGTGVSGRLALHHARGEVTAGDEIVVESVLGTCFAGRVVGETTVGEHAAVVPEVSGRAWITGRHDFLVAPDDPLGEGFLLGR